MGIVKRHGTVSRKDERGTDGVRASNERSTAYASKPAQDWLAPRVSVSVASSGQSERVEEERFPDYLGAMVALAKVAGEVDR